MYNGVTLVHESTEIRHETASEATNAMLGKANKAKLKACLSRHSQKQGCRLTALWPLDLTDSRQGRQGNPHTKTSI